MPKSVSAGSYVTSTCLVLQETILQGGCTTSHPHHQHMSGTVPPHAYQHWMILFYSSHSDV